MRHELKAEKEYLSWKEIKEFMDEDPSYPYQMMDETAICSKSVN